MDAEYADSNVFKLGSVIVAIWPFYHITPWSAIVSITKNEHDETTYAKVLPYRIMVLPGHMW